MKKIYGVRIRGNFYSGRFYEQGVDIVFVLAESEEEAKKISEDNIAAIEDMFRNKRVYQGRRAIKLSDKRKFLKSDIGLIKYSNMIHYDKVLNNEGNFIKV